VTVSFSQPITDKITVTMGTAVLVENDLVNENTIDLSIPANAPGPHVEFKVLIGDFGFTNSINVKYLLTVKSAHPTASSTSGGALLTISGFGFGREPGQGCKSDILWIARFLRKKKSIFDKKSNLVKKSIFDKEKTMFFKEINF